MSAQSQMMSQQAKKMSVVQTEQTEELADQEIFVPLRHVNQMQKNALAEATAMAKMKDDHFELVVNIQKFTPEEVIHIFTNYVGVRIYQGIRMIKRVEMRPLGGATFWNNHLPAITTILTPILVCPKPKILPIRWCHFL